MNKKLIYIFVVLVAGLFVVGACQSEVGINPTIPRDDTTLPGGDNELFGIGGQEWNSCVCNGNGQCKLDGHIQDVMNERGEKIGEEMITTCGLGPNGCEGGCSQVSYSSSNS